MAQKDLHHQLEEEFDRFIEFGNLLDRTSRKYLVWYMRNQLTPGEFEIPELNDQYFRYFKKALDRIFGIDGLVELVKGNEHLNQQILLDTLYWMRKAWDKVRKKNPYWDEQQRLESWAVNPLHIFVKRWPALTHYLPTVYQPHELDVRFYYQHFKELIGSNTYEQIEPETRKRIDLLFNDLLAQWDALFYAKLLQFQLEKLEEEGESYTGFMTAKVDEYKKLSSLIAPFAEYVGRYWDMSRELWKETSFNVLEQYHDLLENEDSIRELADLLGKMREAEIEIEEETFEKVIIRQEWAKDPLMRSEIVGVDESNRLENVLSSEVSLLSDPDTESLFLKKYADQNLLTFRYEDQKLVKSEDVLTEINRNVRLKEKGPFIICVDTSESMLGLPEQIAKVLCLGILKMAAKENRRAYLINFSTGIETLDLLDIADSINEIAHFLRMSFHGGTDISLPLYEAIRQLQGNNYQDADVLVISDFIMYQVDDDVLKDVRYYQQNKGTQFHSLTLSDDPNTKILETFDTNWLYDPKEKGIIKELTRGLQTIGNRTY